MNAEDSISALLARIARGRERYEGAIRAQADVFSARVPERAPLLLDASLDLSAHPSYTPRRTHFDSRLMLAQELRGAACAAAGGRESVPSVRANMGCGIVLSLFGLTQELFDDKMPWLQTHLPKARIAEMTEKDICVTPEFERAMAHMEYMAEKCAGTGARVYPVDIQGAVDTAHLLLGDDFFTELYDDEPFVDHLLRLCEAAIVFAFTECLKRIPGSGETVCHYSAFAMPRALGGIKLSEDTSTLLSKAHIERFAAPSMHRLLARFGGGYIHYCGKNPHLYEAVLREPLARGLNFGNPDMHDMEKTLADCASAGKVFLGVCSLKKEDERDYFRRMLRASRRDGKNWLLLRYACPEGDVARVSDLWDDLCARQED